MFTFLLSEGKYHVLLLPPRFGAESTSYHNWQISSWVSSGNCSCAHSPPRHSFLKLKPENLPCQNQQLCHWAPRSQGSVVNAHKTKYLENFSYLKVFINTALQVCFPYRNKEVARIWQHDMMSLHYLHDLQQRTTASLLAPWHFVSHELCHALCDIFEPPPRSY